LTTDFTASMGHVVGGGEPAFSSIGSPPRNLRA